MQTFFGCLQVVIWGTPELRMQNFYWNICDFYVPNNFLFQHIAQRIRQDGGTADASLRREIQTESVQLGISMQHLGAMFFELGRTMMMLRTGLSPVCIIFFFPSCYITNFVRVTILKSYNSAVWGFCKFWACCLYKLHRTKPDHGSGDNCYTFFMLVLMVKSAIISSIHFFCAAIFSKYPSFWCL